MTKKQTEYCPTCNGRTSGRWESISPGLCTVLIKFWQVGTFAPRSNLRSAHLLKECGLTTVEINNFQKLKYFDLVTKTSISGVWSMTRLGEEFVLNRLLMPKQVYVFRNTVEKWGVERVCIAEAMKSEPFWLKKEHFVSAPMPSVQAGLFE